MPRGVWGGSFNESAWAEYVSALSSAPDAALLGCCHVFAPQRGGEDGRRRLAVMVEVLRNALVGAAGAVGTPRHLKRPFFMRWIQAQLAERRAPGYLGVQRVILPLRGVDANGLVFECGGGGGAAAVRGGCARAVVGGGPPAGRPRGRAGARRAGRGGSRASARRRRRLGRRQR